MTPAFVQPDLSYLPVDGLREPLESHGHAMLNDVFARGLDDRELRIEQHTGRLNARRPARYPESDREAAPPPARHRRPSGRGGLGLASRPMKPPAGRGLVLGNGLGEVRAGAGGAPPVLLAARRNNASNRLPGPRLALMSKPAARSVVE